MDSDDTPDGEEAYTVQAQPKYQHNLTLPVRLQWNANYGYCGSTSMVMAGMYYGAYMSQYDQRYMASNNTKQHLQVSQLLLGVNDYWSETTRGAAAERQQHMHEDSHSSTSDPTGDTPNSLEMLHSLIHPLYFPCVRCCCLCFRTAHQQKLTNELWNYGDLNVRHFLTWIKSQVLQDRVVIMGIYENGYIFDFKGGDEDYDHIVPVTGWGSSHPLTDLGYYDDDVIYFSDNGLYTPEAGGNGEEVSVYHISATMTEIGKTRTDANKRTAGVYSLNSAPTKANPNFAISITGIVDEHNDCLPTSLTSDHNYESPEIAENSDTRPTPMSQVITATARKLVVGKSYNMYMYSAFGNVPSTAFNAAAGQAAQTWSFTATADTWSTTQTVRTDQSAIFRTVLTTAS